MPRLATSVPLYTVSYHCLILCIHTVAATVHSNDQNTATEPSQSEEGDSKTAVTSPTIHEVCLSGTGVTLLCQTPSVSIQQSENIFLLCSRRSPICPRQAGEICSPTAGGSEGLRPPSPQGILGAVPRQSQVLPEAAAEGSGGQWGRRGDW